MAYNSKDTASFEGVWVFCEQRDGVLLGSGVNEQYAKALGGYGADKVYICDHELLKDCTTDTYTEVLCNLVEGKKPEVFLIGATNIGRDLIRYNKFRKLKRG